MHHQLASSLSSFNALCCSYPPTAQWKDMQQNRGRPPSGPVRNLCGWTVEHKASSLLAQIRIDSIPIITSFIHPIYYMFYYVPLCSLPTRGWCSHATPHEKNSLFSRYTIPMKKPGCHWVHPDPFVDAVAVDVVVDKLTLRRTHNSSGDLSFQRQHKWGSNICHLRYLGVIQCYSHQSIWVILGFTPGFFDPSPFVSRDNSFKISTRSNKIRRHQRQHQHMVHINPTSTCLSCLEMCIYN
jgi:hypothetical protein